MRSLAYDSQENVQELVQRLPGMGAGGPTKKGQYGSMGTLAVMQDGNTRVNHRISDFRHTHVKLITLVSKMYGTMGTGNRAELYGLDDKLLAEALAGCD